MSLYRPDAQGARDEREPQNQVQHYLSHNPSRCKQQPRPAPFRTVPAPCPLMNPYLNLKSNALQKGEKLSNSKRHNRISHQEVRDRACLRSRGQVMDRRNLESPGIAVERFDRSSHRLLLTLMRTLTPYRL